MLIVTGQRRGEVAGMTFGELHLNASEWRLPASRTKNANSHTVVLGDLVKAEIASITPISDYVFSTNGRSPIQAFSQIKTKLNAAILANRQADDPGAEPINNWRWHDLRRTCATGLAKLGIAPHVTEAMLNHRSGAIQGVARVYNRHNYLIEARRATAAWEAHIQHLVAGE